MKKYSVILFEKAEDDLVDLSRYYYDENLSFDYVRKILENFEGTLGLVSFFPEAWRKDILGMPGLRRINIKDNYYAYYQINEKEGRIEVLRVLHSSRNITEDFFPN